MTSPLLTLPIASVVVLWLDLIPLVVSIGVTQHSFKSVTSTHFPPDINSYGSPRAVPNLIFCIALCARDSSCNAIYLNEVNPQNPTCYLYSDQVIDLQALTPGTGTYAYFTAFATTATPQSYSVGNVLYTTWYEPQQTLVAVYSFSGISSWTTLIVLFDRDQNVYPQLSTICAQTIYQAVGLSSTMVRIEEGPSTFFRLHVTCEDGEIKQGDATCDSSGHWIVEGSVGVACVSPQCYRISSTNYAQYSGNIHHTRYGTGCSQWSNYHYYSDSKFVFDDYDKSKAENYCRDISGYGRPWCKFGGFYDYCNVPKCEWQP